VWSCKRNFWPIKCLTDIGINHPVMNAYRKGEITQNHGFCQQRRTWKHNDLEITRIIISMTTLLLEWKWNLKKCFCTISSWSKSWSAWFFLSFLTSLLTTLKKKKTYRKFKWNWSEILFSEVYDNSNHNTF
jgi:hypothetical protein